MNKELIDAVENLRRKGVINRSQDIADRMDYNKSTVSNYLNGKARASSSFIKKFEEVFNIKVTDDMIVDNNGNGGGKEGHLETYNVRLHHERNGKLVLPSDAKKEDIQLVIEYLKLMLKSMT